MDVAVDYDHHYLRRSHVPAFGNWELYCSDGGGGGGGVVVDDLPFTQCFESATARQAGGFFPLYTTGAYTNDPYVTGDLYRNDVVTPAMIVVSRHRGRGKGQGKDEHKKKKDKNWAECEAVKVTETAAERRRKIGKAVDEDLYKISPKLLQAKPKRMQKNNTAARLFSCCLLPRCCVS